MAKRYLIYLDNKKKSFIPDDYKYLIKHIQSLMEDFSMMEVREVRISSYFIEIDLSTYGFEQDLFQNAISSRLASVGSVLYCDDLSVSEHFSTKKNVLDHAVFLFNIERFWKSHEVLEGLWRESSGAEKRILNGIILINAAFVHYQKNELDIFISILKRSLEKLSESFGKFYSLDLNQIKEEVTKIIIDKNCCHNFKIFLHQE
jgi:uncharacterized protein